MTDKKAQAKPVRCAIYTRKSTSEGLDQDFNSLDAQREAAEAYVASQKHAGWVLIPKAYNDGGFTGANIDRPALKELLEDMREGLIDCVVVYKVDRLSRSLLDFAQLIRLFEEEHIGFVSVTQQFDTTTSMGRLTLNVLLSFAQFEREMISERTRDKMAAARKKGKWLGGHPILGYDVAINPRRLVVNATEAELVRTIFQMYLKRESSKAVALELNGRGCRTRTWTEKDGTTIGGLPFNASRVQAILRHPAYLGKTEYKGQLYEGEHEAIMDRETFDRAASILDRNRRERDSRKRNPSSHSLKGLLRCASCGTAMTPSYSVKDARRYRFYRCHNSHKNHKATCPNKCVSAPWLEHEVVCTLKRVAEETTDSEDFLHKNLSSVMTPILDVWEVLFPAARAEALRFLVKQIHFDGATGRLRVDFDQDGVKTVGACLCTS